MKILLTRFLLMLLSVLSAHAVQVFASGAAKASLVELYTSEGCSSCPPAERWLSQLRGNPRLWNSFVPVEFHVTFWDNLGWPDHFAKKSFTDREYKYAQAWKTDSVYTPCFVKDGAEWKVPELTLNAAVQVGTLQATLEPDRRITVTFDPTKADGKPLQVWVTLLASDLDSSITRGENAGLKLRHEFTAMELTNTAMVYSKADQRYVSSLLLPDSIPTSTRKAVAVWVTASDDITKVVQATGGWIQ